VRACRPVQVQINGVHIGLRLPYPPKPTRISSYTKSENMVYLFYWGALEITEAHIRYRGAQLVHEFLPATALNQGVVEYGNALKTHFGCL